MYKYLSTHGACYYISYRGVLVGDVSLRNSGELAIVICRQYQNRHIGRRCVRAMLDLAREKGMERVTANIYSFNTQSRNMFLSLGFRETGRGVVRARALNAAFLDKRCALCYAVIRRSRRFPPHKERRIP